MAKRQYTLEAALSTAVHNLDDNKVTIILMGGAEMIENFVRYRFQMGRDTCEAAIRQLAKIREAAKAAGHEDIIKLLDEEAVEAGHDFEPAKKT